MLSATCAPMVMPSPALARRGPGEAHHIDQQMERTGTRRRIPVKIGPWRRLSAAPPDSTHFSLWLFQRPLNERGFSAQPRDKTAQRQ